MVVGGRLPTPVAVFGCVDRVDSHAARPNSADLLPVTSKLNSFTPECLTMSEVPKRTLAQLSDFPAAKLVSSARSVGLRHRVQTGLATWSSRVCGGAKKTQPLYPSRPCLWDRLQDLFHRPPQPKECFTQLHRPFGELSAPKPLGKDEGNSRPFLLLHVREWKGMILIPISPWVRTAETSGLGCLCWKHGTQSRDAVEPGQLRSLRGWFLGLRDMGGPLEASLHPEPWLGCRRENVSFHRPRPARVLSSWRFRASTLEGSDGFCSTASHGPVQQAHEASGTWLVKVRAPWRWASGSFRWAIASAAVLQELRCQIARCMQPSPSGFGCSGRPAILVFGRLLSRKCGKGKNRGPSACPKLT